MDLFSSIFSIIGSVIAAIATYFLKTRVDYRIAKDQEEEIDIEVSRVTKIINDTDNDVLSLMIKNVAESREYYVINKQQARNSFSSALIVSILGFVLFATGLIVSYMMPEKANVIPYSTIGGAIVEIIAGLFFWIYSKAITQINIFHNSLQNTEKFLTAIQLVEKISPDKRDDSYKSIIEKILKSNFSIDFESKDST